MNTKLPYYNYIVFIKRFRVAILLVITTIIVLSSMMIKEGFVYSDQSLWLNGSKEYNKLLQLKYPSLTIEKIVFNIERDGWSIKAIDRLKSFHLNIRKQTNIVSINSLFDQSSIFNNHLSQNQSMIEIIPLLDKNSTDIYNEIRSNPSRFESFIDGNQVTFYLGSDGTERLNTFDCNYPYSRTKVEDSNAMKNFLLFSILFVMLTGSFTVAFRSILPTVLGTIFIVATTLITILLFQSLSSVKVTHISIVLLAVTVSVMDFVYIYYKWHVFQESVPTKILLYRVMTKTIVPIFWTTIISVVGVGSLIFVDSQILHSIGLNVALSSSVGLLLSVTLLPAMLSFFRQKNPELVTKESVKYFAAKEVHYSQKWLYRFLLFSALVFLYGIFIYFYKPMNVITDQSDTRIQLILDQRDTDRQGLTKENLEKLQNIHKSLKEKFSDIESVYSAYSEIEKLYKQEYPNTSFQLDTIDVATYNFMFDLYGISDKVLVNNQPTVTLYLKDTKQKTMILSFVRQQNLLIQDRASLLQMAKRDSINTLFSVVFFVLFLIMGIVYLYTKTMQFVWIAALVNAIPLSWFFATIMLLDMPLSTEMLVAMVITVALSSDATMHFIFFYYSNRLKPRTSEKVLETSFLYIGTALGMGNVILIFTFIALVFVPDPTISNIGLYSSMLVMLSLGMELFLLPILFLQWVKENRTLRGYYH